ncbi:RDD family protein [Actinoallomurus iriomotensis]|uniref:RDD family protein n=1 Tax=Actinoallomurus iriomotensis TaxID=478107 RepID=UPI002556C4BD|nr:RDD family protein [Actinoallomurus iriomotensis]
MSHYEPVEELTLAPVVRRAGARVIDAGLLGIVGFALILPFMVAAVGLDEPGSRGKDSSVWSGPALFGWVLVVGILPFAYEAVQLALWGQTLGKRIMSLRVLAESGEPVRPAQAVGRAAANNVLYLFGCGVGTLMAYLWAIWDEPLHQALHDRLAGTVVVDDREYAPGVDPLTGTMVIDRERRPGV